MLNKRWRQRIIDTEYINERANTTTILVNRQHIKLMSVYFHHSKYADHHIEKMHKTIEKHMAHCDKYIPIIRGDFNAELGLGKGTERKSVGRYTLNEGNRRGDWLKSWLTGYKITPKQTTFISPQGNEKIDYILTKRRHLKHIKDAEANDMIRMGSDHRCVMAIFTTPMLGKNFNHKDMKGKHDTQTAKNISIEKPELENISRNRRNNKKYRRHRTVCTTQAMSKSGGSYSHSPRLLSCVSLLSSLSSNLQA